MKRRRITLTDGRYLIFYTFEDEAAELGSADHAAEQRAPERPVEAGEPVEEKPHV